MSNYILPIIIFLIVLYGIIKKCNVYDSFINGSKEGINLSLNIFPSILAIIFSSRIFISSGLLEFILKTIKPIITFPIEVIPIIILRPISSNASLSIMIDIFNKFGVDSYLGILSSVLQGCTDTVFYIISLYFGVVNIKKIKNTLSLSLLVYLIGIITSIIIVNITYYH